MPKISTDNCFTLEIFGSKSDQRSSAKNGSFRLFRYIRNIHNEADDRLYPWSDNMNKNVPEWRNEPSPFKELLLKWKLYKEQKHLNSWEERPFSWN